MDVIGMVCRSPHRNKCRDRVCRIFTLRFRVLCAYHRVEIREEWTDRGLRAAAEATALLTGTDGAAHRRICRRRMEAETRPSPHRQRPSDYGKSRPDGRFQHLCCLAQLVNLLKQGPKAWAPGLTNRDRDRPGTAEFRRRRLLPATIRCSAAAPLQCPRRSSRPDPSVHSRSGAPRCSMPRAPCSIRKCSFHFPRIAPYLRSGCARCIEVLARKLPTEKDGADAAQHDDINMLPNSAGCRNDEGRSIPSESALPDPDDYKRATENYRCRQSSITGSE